MEQLVSTGESNKLTSNLISKKSFLGKTRDIGVSNFSVKTLSHLLSEAQIVPAVNQVELHPCLPQHGLLRFCTEKNIHVTAYSPIGKNKFTSHEVVTSIAQHHEVTGAQVLLSWGVQRRTSVIPKTENAQRLKDNISVSDAALIWFIQWADGRHSYSRLSSSHQTRCIPSTFSTKSPVCITACVDSIRFS